MAILLSKNIAQCADRATTARRDDRAAGLGLVEILSWMRHCLCHSVDVSLC